MKINEKEWEAITVFGTKSELKFATETLGVYGIDWIWKPQKSGNRCQVAIPKEEYDAIDKKWEEVYRSLKKPESAHVQRTTLTVAIS